MLSLVLAVPCTGTSIVSPPALRLHVAPMQGFTNTHFRFLLRQLSSSAVLWTEMEKAEDLLASESALARRLGGSETQGPVVLQLGGSDPRELARATAAAARFGFDEVSCVC
jgi:tRNA-dihydrouridine synthase A